VMADGEDALRVLSVNCLDDVSTPLVGSIEAAAVAIDHHHSMVVQLESDAAKAQTKALVHAIQAGVYLEGAKDRISHGEWLGWLRNNTKIGSPRTAQLYMWLATNREEIPKCATPVSHLSIRQAVKEIRKLKTNDKGQDARGGSKTGTFEQKEFNRLRKSYTDVSQTTRDKFDEWIFRNHGFYDFDS